MYSRKILYAVFALFLLASCERPTRPVISKNEITTSDAKKPLQKVYHYYFLLTDDFADFDKKDVSVNAQKLQMTVKKVNVQNLDAETRSVWEKVATALEENTESISQTKDKEKLQQQYISLSLEIYSLLTLRDFVSQNTKSATESIIRLLDSGLGKENDTYVGKFNYLIGLMTYYQGNLYLSNKYYSNALKTEVVRNNLEISEACYNNKGINFEILNMFPEAISCYKRSLKLAEKRNDSTGIAQTWINIGNLNFKANNTPVAEKYTQRALSYFTSKGSIRNQAACYQSLAVFNENLNFGKALLYGKKALALHRQSKDMLGMVQTMHILGNVYNKKNNSIASNHILREGLKMSLKHEIYDSAGSIYLLLVKNMISMKSYGNVELYLKKALEAYDKAEYDNRHNYFITKGEYYASIGNFDAYLKNEAEYTRYKEQEQKKKAVETYLQLQSVYENERNAAKISEQKNKIAAIRMREQSLVIISAIFLTALIIVLYYYFRTQKYIKSLFIANVNNMFQTEAQEASDRHRIGEGGNQSFSNLYNQILEVMQEQKLYLLPNLNVADISGTLGTNEKYISNAIKEHGNKNFNAFVNHYRINHAKKMLLEHAGELSLKIVSSDSGFNNHTTFYRQFKEITGLTPTQFMEMCKENLKGVHFVEMPDGVAPDSI